MHIEWKLVFSCFVSEFSISMPTQPIDPVLSDLPQTPAATAPVPGEFKHEMLQAFGEAYKGFGLSKQMGHIVALLLYSPQPLSLDDITAQLGMSKGPISQMTRRLSERNIIRKVWNPGSRKDYYEIQPEVFANAFRNFVHLIKHNTDIAHNLKHKITSDYAGTNPDLLTKRLDEMGTFYALMEQHFTNFLNEWASLRLTLANELTQHEDAGNTQSQDGGEE
jgi:HTH-type transcriptional regulator, osmoprotectant uptake regulator